MCVWRGVCVRILCGRGERRYQTCVRVYVLCVEGECVCVMYG